MKTRIIASITVLACMMACHSTRKTTGLPAEATVPAAPVNRTAAATAKPANGIYEPGPEELSALQARFADASAEQLKMGHMIYSLGACVQCHKAMNIHQRSEAQWVGILDDMAQRARITAGQKEAVYRYILAVKAVKAKQAE